MVCLEVVPIRLELLSYNFGVVLLIGLEVCGKWQLVKIISLVTAW